MNAKLKTELNYLKELAQFAPSKVVSGKYELTLDAISELLSLIGHPEKQLKIIHVAGTNGKGSTIAFLSKILQSAGYRVGVFTSPALLRVTEQIRINDTEISEDDFALEISQLKPFIEQMKSAGHKITTEFETVTAAALSYFAKKSCDITIIECGLGGKSDATNVIPSPLASVISSIGLDHTEILGDTIEKIAVEKSGIIKEHSLAVVLKAPDSVMQIFRDRCITVHSDLVTAPLENHLLTDIDLGLSGECQKHNASLALTTAIQLRSKGLKISDSDIEYGLKNATWTCRFEIIPSRPTFIIDGSHNYDGVKSLVNSIKKLYPDKKVHFIVGVLKDKSYTDMMNMVIPIAYKFYTVTPPSPRALSAKELSEYFISKGSYAIPFDSIEEAVTASLSEASDDDIICSFGSLYYVGIVREYLKSITGFSDLL